MKDKTSLKRIDRIESTYNINVRGVNEIIDINKIYKWKILGHHRTEDGKLSMGEVEGGRGKAGAQPALLVIFNTRKGIILSQFHSYNLLCIKNLLFLCAWDG